MTMLTYSDINECVDFSPCLNDGTCVNTVGGFFCRCLNGWSGDNCGTCKSSFSFSEILHYWVKCCF
ncbi:hypothetical protein DPMN_141480 [Dreissena polymorpha]|uniref:EGF-like domain-containing protein n=1 Tax=Dreissena polymorpha TaxID=45954 RepID=A0A9D4GFG2_DREPO|nr:hypothetical protein DPMN_141480 [Dreissena polymorpha]